MRAATIASAIEINRPVNLPKALRALDRCGGVVREVTDQEILDAKAKVGAGGLGCEPASAASVAGARKLRQEGVIGSGRARRLHPDRPSAEGPDGDGGVSQRRPEDVRRGARQPRRAPGDLRQPGRAGAQRSGRDHQGDRGVFVVRPPSHSRTEPMRRSIPLVLAAGLLAILPGCKSNNADGRLVGTWVSNSVPKTTGPISMTWTFAADSSFTVSAQGPGGSKTITGKYHLGSRRRLHGPPQREGRRQDMLKDDITITGNQMTVRDPDGTTTTFTKQ